MPVLDEHQTMPLVTTTDTETVLGLAAGALTADPLRNTVFSSIAAGVTQDDAAGWAAHPAGEPLVLVARSQLHTPVSFTAGWTDLREVIDELTQLDPLPAAVAGPASTVDTVVAGLGRAVLDRDHDRLFRLGEFRQPRHVAGEARLAGTGDAAFLADWFIAFNVEAFGRLPANYDAPKQVTRTLTRSRCWIWDVGGTPCSMAVRQPVVGGVSRIGPVYTPTGLRGRGYGSAITAAASQDILDDNAVACLFTDLANPTSNKIYQALGYVPVLDRMSVRFA